MIENDGYIRKVSYSNMYVNSSSVISITDYDGAQVFLLSENSPYANDNFSLVRINQGGKIDELIVFGTADEVFSEFETSRSPPNKRLLNE